MTARHHHYLSQCYLKGFTAGESKKSKLVVIDLQRKKSFETIPRNVGGIRDFNRIEVEGVDPNYLESELAKFEGEAATALKRLRDAQDFSGRDRDTLIQLMALIAVRSPERREHKRQFHEQIAERIMDILHSSEEFWDQQMQQMEKDDPSFERKVSYAESKRFHDSKAYTVDVAREYHIHTEMEEVKTLVPFLAERNWLLVTANADTGPLITTDSPVCLTWKDPDKVPPALRRSPGFGLKETEVYFPVSQHLGLIGEFDGPQGTLEANKELVSLLNANMLYNLHSQVYSPKLDFKFFGRQNALTSGKEFLRELKREHAHNPIPQEP